MNTNTHSRSGKHCAKRAPRKAEGQDLAEEFHVYALDRSEKELVWHFGGKEVRGEANTICRGPAHVHRSSAIIQWAGPVADAIGGTALEVDCVRIYERPDLAPG